MISCVYNDGVTVVAVVVLAIVVAALVIIVVLAVVSSTGAVLLVVVVCSLYGSRGDDPTNRNCHSPLSMTSSRDHTSPRMVYPVYNSRRLNCVRCCNWPFLPYLACNNEE